MPKLNRGTTTKLSMKLSASGRQVIEKAAENLNLSKAGIILFALAKIMKEVPTKEDVLNLESKIELEPGNFPVTVKVEISEEFTDLAKKYGMKKNELSGLIISNYFENLEEDSLLLVDREDLEEKKLQVFVNKDLKKKIDEYAEEHFIPMSGLISYAVLRGTYESLPSFESSEQVNFFTNVPEYVLNKIKREAEQMNIREHFYVSLCLYREFMTPQGEFF